MYQNRRLLLNKKPDGLPRVAITVEILQSLNFSESMGQQSNETVVQSLLFTQTLLQVLPETIIQSMAFNQTLVELLVNLVAQSLTLNQTVSTAGSTHPRLLTQSLVLTQSLTGYITNPLAVCDDPGGGSTDEDFVLEEV